MSAPYHFLVRCMRSRRPHVFAILMLLAGCAGMAPLPVATGPSIGRSVLHEAIDLDGRLSVHYAQNGKEEAVHGGFTWAQTPQRMLVRLFSPLGQTLATIDVAPGTAVFTQAGQPPRMASDVDALAAETLGWPLPISGLRNWLQGFVLDTGGHAVAAPRTDDAAITTRDGWHIRYVSWEGDAPTGQIHPKRIDLARYTEQAGDVSIRIVIDTWQVH